MQFCILLSARLSGAFIPHLDKNILYRDVPKEPLFVPGDINDQVSDSYICWVSETETSLREGSKIESINAIDRWYKIISVRGENGKQI